MENIEESGCVGEGAVELILTLSKVRQIAKCDDLFEGGSAEFVEAVAVATELFVQYFVEKAAVVALSETRKKITNKDLVRVIHENENMIFLENVFNDNKNNE